MNELTIIDNQTIQNKIYTIRDVQVMVSRDVPSFPTSSLGMQIDESVSNAFSQAKSL